MAGQGYRHWLVGRGKERGPELDRPRLGEPPTPTGGTADWKVSLTLAPGWGTPDMGGCCSQGVSREVGTFTLLRGIGTTGREIKTTNNN